MGLNVDWIHRSHNNFTLQSWGICPPFWPQHYVEMSGHLHSPAALSGERVTGTHWIGGWMGSTAGPDAMKYKKVLAPVGTEPQIGSAARPVSYPMGKGDLSPWAKRQGRDADHFQIVPKSRMMGLCLHSPICFNGIVLNSISTETTLLFTLSSKYFSTRQTASIHVTIAAPRQSSDRHVT
jgi:hypothetical protein